ncbi:MAG: [LysW]-aminoadipate kinase [Anaerolineae bacterium]|nr:[LysW]-aminoadipate kinase [Anaerolineae bacterium]MCX8067803.1 [LysW]-aminoadipate kinase [Anaerolineae bacterium]
MIVVKIGGAQGIDPGPFCEDVAALVAQGRPIVVVHGGSHETNVISERLGKPPRYVTSTSGHQSRYTDRETLEIFAMVVGGRVNKLLVEQLQRRGVNALGLSGADGRLLEAKRKSTLKIVEDGKVKILRDEWSGVVERVNVSLLRGVLAGGYVPVVAPLAISTEGEMVNVDGDRAAAAIAAALGADTLVLLTNVPGLLRAFPDETTLVSYIPRDEIEAHMVFAQGRMKRKLLGAQEAILGGVRRVVLADGRAERPVLRALEGKGTVVE